MNVLVAPPGSVFTITCPINVLLKKARRATLIHKLLHLTLKELSHDHPDAAQLLKFLTLLHPRGVPFSFVAPFLKAQGSLQTDHSVLSILYQQSLVDVQKQPHVRLSMHELIHQLLGQNIPPKEARHLLEKAIPIVSKPFENRSDLVCKEMAKYPEYLMHAQKVCEKAKAYDFFSKELLILKIRMLDVLLCQFRDGQGFDE